MKEYPTPWQRKTMWAALTACFVVLLVIIVGAVIWAAANVISFLQPILIPVAIAVILTYLLDPLVTKCLTGRSVARKPWLLFSRLRFSRWEDWPRGSSPPSQSRARILPGKFPPTLNEHETP